MQWKDLEIDPLPPQPKIPPPRWVIKILGLLLANCLVSLGVKTFLDKISYLNTDQFPFVYFPTLRPLSTSNQEV